MPQKRTFWVLSKQTKEIGSFGPMTVPARFKTIEDAKKFCRELNFRKGIYHPGYFVEERIGDQPVKAQPSKKAGPASEDSD
jgi:hypothetical protein